MGMLLDQPAITPLPARWTPQTSWREGAARNVTFLVTADCQLRCRYCYVVGKHGGARMPLEIARRSIDFILADRRLSSAPAIIWDFVGGEPLLEIELIDQICDYAKLRMYALGHPWFDAYRFSLATNGLLYDDPRVQRFIEKNKTHLSIGISLDGGREKHDAQRIYPDGRGSYDDVVRNIPLWLAQFPGASTKVTIAHDDLPYLAQSILHLWQLGIEHINANVVFEDVWQPGDDELFEAQMRVLADAMLSHDIPAHYSCSLFNRTIGHRLDPLRDNQNWCGAGKMLAVDAEGNFYPCNRFVAASLQHHKPIIVGNCDTGIDENRLRPFLALTRTAQSPPECLECAVASGCAWCQGENYDSAESATIYQRRTAICGMHKARVRANSYFWEHIDHESDGVVTPTIRSQDLPQWSLSGLTHLIVLLESGATAFCQEAPEETSASPQGMTPALLARIAVYAADRQLALSVIYGVAPTREYDELLATLPHVKIVPFALYAAYPESVLVIDFAELAYALAAMPGSGRQAIVRIARADLPSLAEGFAAASRCFKRLNTVLLDIEHYTDEDLQCYEEQLEKLGETLAPRYLCDEAGEISCLTDRPALTAMRNCGAGVTHLTVSPDGRLYLCPASYRRDAGHDVGSFADGPHIANRQLLALDHAPICERCDAFHCPRCIYMNAKLTGEVNTPSRQQCELAHIERAASARLLQLVHDDERFRQYNMIPDLDYRDPFDLLLRTARWQ